MLGSVFVPGRLQCLPHRKCTETPIQNVLIKCFPNTLAFGSPSYKTSFKMVHSWGEGSRGEWRLHVEQASFHSPR